MARRIEEKKPPTPASSLRGGVASREAVPDVGNIAGPVAPRLRPEPAYMLVVWPERWGVIESMVVPICSKLSASRGANGVGWNERTKKPQLELAKAQVVEKGGTPIPWDVDGPGRSYLQQIEGWGWLSRWETVYAGSDQRSVDSKGYAEWLRSLIDRGVIRRPQLYVLEALAEQLRARLGELAKRGNVGAYQPRIERTKADLKAVEDEIQRTVSDLQAAVAGEQLPDVD